MNPFRGRKVYVTATVLSDEHGRLVDRTVRGGAASDPGDIAVS
jgi:hypothetical protein